MEITVYELLGLIKDGQKIPKTIKYRNKLFQWYNWNGNFYDYVYSGSEGLLNDGTYDLFALLNQKVEIIEEHKSLNDIRTMYGLPRIENNFTGYKMYADGKEVMSIESIPYTEENKIPEKLETYKENNEIFLENSCYKYMPIHKDSLSFNEQVIVDKLNEVLDYLKSKGE